MTHQDFDREFARRFDTEQEAVTRAQQLGPQWSAIKLRGRKFWQLARAA